MLLEESDDGINEETRSLIARCLDKFVPSHPDFFDFYGIGLEKRLERLCAGDQRSEVGIALCETFIKVKARIERQRELSEPE